MENNDWYQMPEDERYYRESRKMLEASLAGVEVKRTGKKKNVNNNKLKNKVVSLCLATVIGVSGLVATGNVIKSVVSKGSDKIAEFVDEKQDNNIVMDQVYNFKNEYINPAKEHINGTTNDYYIHYDKVADTLNNSDNFDRDLYMTCKSFEVDGLDTEEQINEVFKYNETYENLNDYLDKNDYSTYYEFEDDQVNSIIKDYELAEMNQEGVEVEGEKTL